MHRRRTATRSRASDAPPTRAGLPVHHGLRRRDASEDRAPPGAPAAVKRCARTTRCGRATAALLLAAIAAAPRGAAERGAAERRRLSRTDHLVAQGEIREWSKFAKPHRFVFVHIPKAAGASRAARP